MNLREHDNQDGKMVWLSESEIQTLLAHPDSTQTQIAYGLAARSGLRSFEVLAVTPQTVQETDMGWVVRVHDGKGSKYRETPVPESLALQIQAAGSYRDAPDTAKVLDVNSTRAMRKWIERDREQLAEQTGDDGWRQLSWHDLRRSWATNLKGADVDPLLVLDWGGWQDLQTFLEHYRGTYSPEVQRKQRAKVEWL
jgi:integrase